MSFSIFHDMCLMCSNFNCQEQSFHKKYTLVQIETLLIKNTFLNAFLQKYLENIQQNSLKTLSMKIMHSFQYNYTYQSFNENCSIYEISKCIQKILKSFQQNQFNRITNIEPLQSLMLASLSTIQFLQTIQTNSLLYHDVWQLINLIQFYKFNEQKTDLEYKNIYLTQSRIKRTIRYLQKNILLKQKKAKLIKINSNHSVNNNQNILGNITNKCLNTNSQNDNQNKSSFFLQKPNRMNRVNIQISNQQHIIHQFYNSIHNCFEKTSLNKLTSVQEIKFMLNQIQQIQSIYIEQTQKLANQKNYQHKNISCPQMQNKQMQKSQNSWILLNPQKSFYPIIHKTQQIKNENNSQLSDPIQYIFIQGIPFPTNRRSIDFSMLQLTDELLITYFPAMQKFKDLEEICIRKNHLSPLSYKILKNTFSNLHSLDLRQNLITEEITQILLQFKSLNILYLSQCQIHPISLVKIGINLQNINVLYCDKLIFLDSNSQQTPQNVSLPSSDFRGIFYIICLNLKKLMYFSLKGYFSQMTLNYVKKSSILQNQKNSDQIKKETYILKNIYQTLKKRHGIIEI